MKTYRLQCEVTVPDNVTDEQVLYWARFNLNERATMDTGNPLQEEDIEANWMTTQVTRLTRHPEGYNGHRQQFTWIDENPDLNIKDILPHA